MTPFQVRCCTAIRKAPNGIISTVYLADVVKSSNVAVVSAMRSLERQNLAGSMRSDNSQWAALLWFLRGDLKHNQPEDRK